MIFCINYIEMKKNYMKYKFDGFLLRGEFGSEFDWFVRIWVSEH